MLQEPSNIRVKDGKKETDECKPQRYLRKALAIAENFKYKYHLEQRVSSELARRRELCKLQRLEDSTLIDSIERELKKLVKIGYSGSDPYAASDRQSDASIITHKPTVQITANDVKHWAWAPEPFVGNDGEGVDESQTQRRLRKAVTVAEKFKNKYHLEQQVSSELARECDNFNRQRKEDREIIDSMEIELRRLVRLGYKGIGPVTARSTTSSTPAAALSPSKMTIAHFSDTNSIATIADDRAGVSVGTLDKHFSLSRISAKCLHEDKDGCVIKSEWNQEIDVNSTSGRLMGIEMYNEREVQTRTDKENEDGIGLQEERNMNRGMWKESDIAFSEEYMEVKGTEKWKVSKEEKEKERMMEQAKLIEEEREREMEMIRGKENAIERERERGEAAEVEMMREKEKERARGREREKESVIERERESEKAAEVERIREKEKERAMEQAKLVEEEREREMGREIVTMKCVESGEELESYQERVEEWHRRSQEQHQSNRPKVLPSSLKIITSANDPKTGATTSIPLPLQPPFDVAKYDSKDSQGKVGVNNERVEERHDSQTVKSVYEEKSVVQGQPSSSSSVPSETILQPVTRPVLSVTVAAAVAADGDHSRPLATAIRRDPVPKLFEHFMVVGASFEVRIDLLEYSETQALRNPASLLLRM